jgi:hypothetical protein
VHTCFFVSLSALQATSDRLYTAVEALTAALNILQQIEVQTASTSTKLSFKLQVTVRNRKPQVRQPVMHAASSEDQSAHTTEEQSAEQSTEQSSERSAEKDSSSADFNSFDDAIDTVDDVHITSKGRATAAAAAAAAAGMQQDHDSATTLYMLEHVDALQRAALRERAKVC